MIWPTDDIEVVARQAQFERLHEPTSGEFVCHQHITENPDPLPAHDCLDGMKFLPETQVLHVLERGHFAPLALSRGKPSRPGGRLAIDRRPIAVDQNVIWEVDRSLQASR